MKPYYESEGIRLYLGDMREVLPSLALKVDLVLTDPPYQCTSLAWDRWPTGWPADIVEHTAATSMWCFGSMRMFLDRGHEFRAAGWKLSQDVVWEKHNASGPDADRFRRIHEHALHWYRGPWGDVHHEAQRLTTGVIERGRIVGKGAKDVAQRGEYGTRHWTDDGTRLMTSVIRARSMHRNGGIHPTEKPLGILQPLIAYGCPEGGLVLDPFAGSGSTLDAARLCGRRAVGIEGHEPYAEAAAKRLDRLVLMPAADYALEETR